MDAVERLVERLRTLRPEDEDEREQVKSSLVELARGPGGADARATIETLMRSELLEVRWELEDVLDTTAPRKSPPPEKKKVEEPKEPERLSSSDLVLVYDDPRGLLLHRTRTGDRWFATQADPRTGQPVTFELPADQVAAVKQQLAGSPYWVLGTDLP